MNKAEKLEKYSKRAHQAYQKGDTNRWVSAFWCNKVVGTYTNGTQQLADEMSLSTDTVEDMAHAYFIYARLRKSKEARDFVRLARQSPYIYMAHFRALYDARERYELKDGDLIGLLMDIYQAEGGISSRDVAEASRKKYGKQDSWTYYAKSTQKSLKKLLDQPDFPKPGRRVAKKAFLWLDKVLPKK